MPKSVPRLVVDKVRQVLQSEVLNSNVYVQLVPKKSLLQEKCESERKEGEREYNNFDFACVGGRERNILMRSGL